MIWIHCFWATVNENNILKTCTADNLFVQFNTNTNRKYRLRDIVNIYDNSYYLSMLSESKDCFV